MLFFTLPLLHDLRSFLIADHQSLCEGGVSLKEILLQKSPAVHELSYIFLAARSKPQACTLTLYGPFPLLDWDTWSSAAIIMGEFDRTVGKIMAPSQAGSRVLTFLLLQP